MKFAYWFLIPFICASCTNPTPKQQALIDRAARAVDISLKYAETKGKISAEDAELVRELGVVVLPPAVDLPPVVVTP